mgnify:CR=1 FL=1
MKTEKLIEVLGVCSGRNALNDCAICPYLNHPNCRQQLIETCWFKVKNDKKHIEELKEVIDKAFERCEDWQKLFEDISEKLDIKEVM